MPFAQFLRIFIMRILGPGKPGLGEFEILELAQSVDMILMLMGNHNDIDLLAGRSGNVLDDAIGINLLAFSGNLRSRLVTAVDQHIDRLSTAFTRKSQ